MNYLKVIILADGGSGIEPTMTEQRQRKHVPPADREQLSTALEDYLETIHSLHQELGEVRISDIALRLGVKLPPVTRAVQALHQQGYVLHEARREVQLTEAGRRMAAALSHRHRDIVYLLEEVLGVRPEVAEADTCQLEHGISPETAQCLHEFLEHFIKLDATTRKHLRPVKVPAAFDDLPDGRGAGWRA